MTVQMTVRIGDAEARFVDDAVAAGRGSRADVISAALAREMRREVAARDAAIYSSAQDPDLDSDAYARWAASNAAVIVDELG